MVLMTSSLYDLIVSLFSNSNYNLPVTLIFKKDFSEKLHSLIDTQWLEQFLLKKNRQLIDKRQKLIKNLVKCSENNLIQFPLLSFS